MHTIRNWLGLILAGWIACTALTAKAADTTEILGQSAIACPDAKVFGKNLISGICWSSMFPIYFSNVQYGGNGQPGYHDRYTGMYGFPICSCRGNNALDGATWGFPISFYMPAKLIEVTRRPYCSPTLGGAQFKGLSAAFGPRGILGGVNSSGSSRNRRGGFYNWNLFSFPILQMMQVLNFPKCVTEDRLDLDLLQSSVVYPNWYNAEIAAFLNPELSLFTNPAAFLAMPLSSALANLNTESGNKIDDTMYWVAGSWGMLLPFTGDIPGVSGFVTGHSLVNTRALAMLSRIGFLKSTAGAGHAGGRCERQPMPLLQKSQFKYAMLFPVPESKGLPTDNPVTGASTAVGPRQPFAAGGREIDFTALNGNRCSHNIGKSEMLWGSWRQRPATGEDAVTLIFQWVDCCVGKSIGVTQ